MEVDISAELVKFALGRECNGPHPNKKKGLAMQTQKPSVKLEDWAVVPGPNSGSYQSLRPGNLLVGRAFGHQRIETGKFIFSSPIVRVDAQLGIVETRNTCYSLGEASQEYKAWSREQTPRKQGPSAAA
jgi:hypothetical protein